MGEVVNCTPKIISMMVLGVSLRHIVNPWAKLSSCSNLTSVQTPCWVAVAFTLMLLFKFSLAYSQSL